LAGPSKKAIEEMFFNNWHSPTDRVTDLTFADEAKVINENLRLFDIAKKTVSENQIVFYLG